MELFNLFALAEDRRIIREREARFERLRRRKQPRGLPNADPVFRPGVGSFAPGTSSLREPVVRTAEKRCTGTVKHASQPS